MEHVISRVSGASSEYRMWHFFCCFSSKNLCFYHFHFVFWWSIKFPQQNINQSETGTDNKQIVSGTVCITSKYNPHFDNYIKYKRPSQIMMFKKFTNTGIFYIHSLQKNGWSESLFFCSIICKCMLNNVFLFITWPNWEQRTNIFERPQKTYSDLFI